MINEFLSGKLASASLKTPIVEGGLRPSTLDEIEKWWNEIGQGKQARLIIEQSRAWKPAAQHESSYAGLPPPRPGGRVQLTGLSSRQELNGVRGTLMQFVEDAGRWPRGGGGRIHGGSFLDVLDESVRESEEEENTMYRVMAANLLLFCRAQREQHLKFQPPAGTRVRW